MPNRQLPPYILKWNIYNRKTKHDEEKSVIYASTCESALTNPSARP